MDTLWPSTYVSEANLTNTLVCLRKVLGRDAIRTVSKHGYRFVLPVQGEPGVAREIYEKFARAKELTLQRSLASVTLARDLYWICLAEDPTFAPAWAWLGRCCWFVGKFSGSASADLELADAAFRRAFLIDPDLACAHQFYTPVEADMGEASRALVRLLTRIERSPGEPESFTGLVQVLRFCGLLRESIAAHERAIDLDPTATTSVPHTLFLNGDYAATIETYSGRTGYYLDAAAWAALGDKVHACTLLRDRLARMSLSRAHDGLDGIFAGCSRRAIRRRVQLHGGDENPSRTGGPGLFSASLFIHQGNRFSDQGAEGRNTIGICVRPGHTAIGPLVQRRAGSPGV